MIVWVRDPRPPDEVANVTGWVRLPGGPGDEPQGLGGIDCTPLRAIVRRSRLLRRPVRFASPAPDALTSKAPGTYGVDPGRLALLPNPIDVSREPGPKASRPRVLFLGRLDPIKRPWLFAELARSFGDVDFVTLGQSHFRGRGCSGSRTACRRTSSSRGTCPARRSSTSSTPPGSSSAAIR